MNNDLRIHPHPRRIRRLVALGAVAVLALAACGGDDDEPAADDSTAPADEPPEATSTSTSDDGESTTPADEPESTSTSGAEIVIAGFAFSGVEEVAVGTTVTVVNDDSTTHTWSAVDGAFDSGGLAPGDTFEFTFDEPGTYDYVCNIHPSMTGTIVVTG